MNLDLDNSIKTALSQHPTIEKAKADLDASEAQVTMAWSQHLPSLSFSYGYGWGGEPQIPKNKNQWNQVDSWSIRFNVGLNIFSGFLITSDINSAKHSKRAFQERLVQQKRDLELEIRKSYLNVKAAEEKITVTQGASESAE
mgnify:FL=1